MTLDSPDDGALDPRLVKLFVRELHWQAETALGLIDRLVDDTRPIAREFWPLAQALLGAFAICSKILWPSPMRSKELRAAYPNRGPFLRQLTGVGDDSSLANRDIRDAFEHIDERFERWALESTANEPLDSAIVEGVDVTIQFADSSDKNVFRFYDNGRIKFWQLELPLHAIRDELARLHMRCSALLASG